MYLRWIEEYLCDNTRQECLGDPPGLEGPCCYHCFVSPFELALFPSRQAIFDWITPAVVLVSADPVLSSSTREFFSLCAGLSFRTLSFYLPGWFQADSRGSASRCMPLRPQPTKWTEIPSFGSRDSRSVRQLFFPPHRGRLLLQHRQLPAGDAVPVSALLNSVLTCFMRV
jgi:hypothetical protein